jgi:hypothetical protein
VALDHLGTYRAARAWMRQDADLVLDTTALRAAEAAQLIADALPGPQPATRCSEGRFRQGSTCKRPGRSLFAFPVGDRWRPPFPACSGTDVARPIGQEPAISETRSAPHEAVRIRS